MSTIETTITVPLWAFAEPDLRKLISTIKEVERALYVDAVDTIPNPNSVNCIRLCIEELQMRCPNENKQPLNGYFRHGLWVQPYRQY